MNFSQFMTRFIDSITSNEVLWQHEVEDIERLFPELKCGSNELSASKFQDRYYLLYSKVHSHQSSCYQYLTLHRVADEESNQLDVYDEIERLKEYFERSTIVRRRSLLTRWNTLIALRQITNKSNVSLKGLTELPEKIIGLLSRFSELRALELEFCAFTSLPESISRLVTIESLRVNNTCLEYLPDSIGSLTSLTSLNFNDNKISSVPATIACLSNLRFLGLSGNMIATLPTEGKPQEFLANLGVTYDSIADSQKLGGNKVDPDTWPKYWAMRLSTLGDISASSA